MKRPRVALMIENVLGHAAHADNLRRLLPRDEIEPLFVPIEYAFSGRFRLPVLRNWTVDSGRQARRGIRGLRRSGPVGALFFHTQVPAMLSLDLMHRIPSVVSIDATPRQMDDLG